MAKDAKKKSGKLKITQIGSPIGRRRTARATSSAQEAATSTTRRSSPSSVNGQYQASSVGPYGKGSPGGIDSG